MRLDWLFLDEEEMLEPAQVEIVYPQLHGRLSKSKIGKFFHLGTMQYATLFMENIKKYPSSINSWELCPWLVDAGQIQGYIDKGIMPKFEIDMLYRCIASVPGGAFFENLKIIKPYKYDKNLVGYGMDHGSIDHCTGVIIDGKKCTVVEEYEKDIERDNTAYDFLDGADIETEGGGYNDDVRYSAKATMMSRRIGARKTLSTQKWKQNRKMYARGFDVIEIFETCEKTIKDLQGCRFGPDTLWLKNRETPCHKVDSFMRAIGSGHSPKVYNTQQHEVETDRFRLLYNLRKKQGYGRY